ncbi:MAG: ribonuclease P protein component [Candidatus Berkelbacteria bacterium]
MLTRSFRLQKKDMERIYKKGRNFRQDLFLIRFLPNRAGHSRFSVVISKKVLALATARNQFKRKAYQIISESETLWKDKAFDFALILKKAEKENLEESIKNIFKEVK